MDPLAITFRWLHIGTAVLMIGGAFFFRMVLAPTANSVLDADTHERLRAPLIRRWAMMLHIFIALLLISGLYNYLVVTRPKHAGQGLYHGLMGGKILLALLIFGLVEGPAKKKPMVWIPITLLLAGILLAMSATLRYVPTV